MSFRIAERQALRSDHKQHKLGAVIVKGGNILATGFNQLRPSSLLKKPTIHAEAAAILQLLKGKRLADLAGSTMYVTRFTRGGAVGLAKPCSDCMALIRSVGISRVIYSSPFGPQTIRL